jgi:DNA primase
MAKPYKTECPRCHSSGNNFYITPDNGIGYCFNCFYFEKDGEFDDKPRKMSDYVEDIRALYTQAARYYHNSLTTKATKYLYQRGFNDKTIQDLQIGYCPEGKSPLYKGMIARDAGLVYPNNTGFLADRITFPYLADNGMVTDIRGRSMNPDDETKYKSLLGSSYYRGAIYPYNYHLHTEKQILLTEGEIKADIAYQIGIPTMALPGMGIWREGLHQCDNTEFIILYDTQKHNMHFVRHAIIRTARKLKNPKVATMPLMGEEKQDIDSFILRYGKDAFQMVIKGALDFDKWYLLQRF